MFTVNQATGCTFTLSPSSECSPPAVEVASVSLTTGAGCAWSLSSSAELADPILWHERHRYSYLSLRRRSEYRRDAVRKLERKRRDVHRDGGGSDRPDRTCSDRQAERYITQFRHHQRGKDKLAAKRQPD